MTDAEITALCAALYEWGTPASFLQAVDTIESDQFFWKSKAKPAQEAWLAAQFCKAVGGGNVRLVRESRPDFEIEMESRSELFECVAPTRDGYMLGLDYKFGAPPRTKSVAEMRAEAEAIPEMLRSAIRKKVAKKYPKHFNLLIYLHVCPLGILHRENIAAFAENTAEGREHFRSIWILYCDEAFNPWPASGQ